MRYLSKVRVVVRVRARVQRHQPARARRAEEAPEERGVDLAWQAEPREERRYREI